MGDKKNYKNKTPQKRAHEISDEEKSQRSLILKHSIIPVHIKVPWEAQPHGPRTNENKQEGAMTVLHTCEKCD